jgi:tRNA(fMet)-specific endonuclease VapC
VAQVVPFGTDEADAYAQLRAAVARAGASTGRADLMIPAAAVASGRALLTLDASDFERIPGLVVRRYEPPEPKR